MTASGLAINIHLTVAEIGGSFTGHLTRQADADGHHDKSRARAVRLELRYRTEGRGDTNSDVVSRASYDLDARGGLNVGFELAVPSGSPISYDGQLIRVIWELEARVDLKLARDVKVERHVLVAPVGGLALYDRPHPLPTPIRSS